MDTSSRQYRFVQNMLMARFKDRKRDDAVSEAMPDCSTFETLTSTATNTTISSMETAAVQWSILDVAEAHMIIICVLREIEHLSENLCRHEPCKMNGFSTWQLDTGKRRAGV